MKIYPVLQVTELPRETQGDGAPQSSVSPGRFATSSFTCALGHPATLLRRGKRAVARLGMWAEAATEVKEEAAQRPGDMEWTPPPAARGFARPAPFHLLHEPT